MKEMANVLLAIYVWGPLMLLALGCCMDADDFWCMEDNNSSTTHRQQMLRKVHM